MIDVFDTVLRTVVTDAASWPDRAFSLRTIKWL